MLNALVSKFFCLEHGITKYLKLDNLVDLVRNMSDSGGFDERRVLLDQHYKNKATNHVAVTLRVSDRGVQMGRSRSQFEGNVGKETKNPKINITFCCRC